MESILYNAFPIVGTQYMLMLIINNYNSISPVTDLSF